MLDVQQDGRPVNECEQTAKGLLKRAKHAVTAVGHAQGSPSHLWERPHSGEHVLCLRGLADKHCRRRAVPV